MVSIADRPIFFVHQTQKKNIDIYQKNRVCFILTPNITVEYTQTPKTVKIPVSVNDFFKSELKGFRTISTTYRMPDCLHRNDKSECDVSKPYRAAPDT
jgi:hypothetical protein